MVSINAYINFGRWVADCPDCLVGAHVVKPGDTFVCGNCFPGVIATIIKSVGNDRYAPMPDDVVRAETVKIAQEAGREYQVSFPENHKALFEELRPRMIENMNWAAGETIEDLQNENAAKGVI